MNEFALSDSNVLLYLFDKDPAKKTKAAEILQRSPFVHPQVLCEVANVLRRRFKFDKASVLNAIEDILMYCACLSFTEDTFRAAFALIARYDFQLFDGIIVAAALEARCTILYSEDMQHELLVNGKLRIINPFL
jgi:predicted nucleic acid-binding protein